MEYRVEAINPIECVGWDDWVLSAGGNSIFQSAAWARVLADTYGYKPRYLTLSRNGSLEAAWPICQTQSVWRVRKGVSLPFSDHCEPILPDPESFRLLFDGVIRCAEQLRWKTIEFRGADHFLKKFPSIVTYNLHVLDLLPNEEEMLRRYAAAQNAT